jgi:hypothetical protein
MSCSGARYMLQIGGSNSTVIFSLSFFGAQGLSVHVWTSFLPGTTVVIVRMRRKSACVRTWFLPRTTRVSLCTVNVVAVPNTRKVLEKSFPERGGGGGVANNVKRNL